MSLTHPGTDYTDKDFDSLRARLYALIRSAFPEWTDENVAQFGNILVELYCQVGDVLTYYQDNQAAESRITTATQRRSLLGLCKLIGFAPSGARAASADVVLSIASPTPGNVLIPKGTVVKTEDVTSPVEFQITSMATIPAGSTSTTATAKHSKPAQDTFTSTGLANQELVLTSTPYLDDSLVLVASDGTYIQVTNFLDSGPTDKHFTVVVDQNDRATARFGNGVNGAIPSGIVVAAYEVGGGGAGIVESGAIRRIEGIFTDVFGNAVTVSVTNPGRSSGGANRMTNAQIAVLAPASIRAPTRCVAREDFEIHAMEVSGVARALMVTSNEDGSVAENSGVLYVVPTGGGEPSSILLADVRTQVTVTYPPTLTFRVYVQAPTYKTVGISAIVYPRQGVPVAAIRAAVTAAATAWFAPQNSDGTPNTLVEFGANMKDSDGNVDPRLSWSDLFNLVRDTAGIRKVDAGASGFLLNGDRADVLLAPREFPRLGDIVLINGDTGEAF